MKRFFNAAYNKTEKLKNFKNFTGNRKRLKQLIDEDDDDLYHHQNDKPQRHKS
jgi:hypothetical protein